VHSVRSLDAADRAKCDDMPVTTVQRTLVDLADTVNDRTLRRAVIQAQLIGRAGPVTLRRQIARSPGRHGVRRLAALLDDGLAPTRSVLEEKLLALVRHSGLPQPEVNTRIDLAGREIEVDLLFADRRLASRPTGRNTTQRQPPARPTARSRPCSRPRAIG
jgi:hypothetical protein